MGRILPYIYGYAQVEYFYEYPNLLSHHGGLVYNESWGIHPDWPENINVKIYLSFTSEILGPGIAFRNFDNDKEYHREGTVGGRDAWQRGHYTIFM